MKYFRNDLGNFWHNKIIRILIVGLLFVMVASPISMYLLNNRWDEFATVIGENPFQFWLLMDSVGWGHAVYHAAFWVLPVLLTGLIYYNEKRTSVYEFLIIRGSRRRYFISKAFSQFVFSFLAMFIVLTINVVVTYVIYPIDAPMTEQYMYLIPKEGMFSFEFYEISPIYMVFLYTFLNALAIALLSVLVLGVHEVFVFKNVYLAFLVPFIGIYVIYYMTSILLGEQVNYMLAIILQPRAACSFMTYIRGLDVVTVFGMLLCMDVIVLIVGYIRNRNVC